MKHRIVSAATIAAMVVSFLAVLGIAGFEMYVRWFINQNYVVLGGSELEVLTASAFVLTLGLAYIYRKD